MRSETKTRSGQFATGTEPWLLGGAMLLVYLLTLNHWVTPGFLPDVVDAANWSHTPRTFAPVSFLVKLPLRLLPASIIPLALNLFSAVCTALSLCLLARSVSLLPHDRTAQQRLREQSRHAILSIPAAWVPPLVAVVICGLQMSLWEHATQASSDTFDLLLFAFSICCLLEYRVRQEESWLTRFAIVCGLGMANNWAMVGFFPAFLVALVWIKGAAFFNPRFLGRLLLLGFAGFSVILLFPLINGLTHAPHTGFWDTLHTVLGTDKRILTTFPRQVFLVLALTSIVPVFMIGIRWVSYFGDESAMGIFLATTVFHIVHGVLLLLCLWVALDSPMSPRVMGMTLPFLTFYYLCALSIGYFSGYFLLIFGTRPAKERRDPHPAVQASNMAITGIVCLILVATSAVMIGKNLPHLLSVNAISRGVERYFAQVEQSLPQNNAVVLSDDSFRLYYVRAILSKHGRDPNFLLINTTSLNNNPNYLRDLALENPAFQIPVPATNKEANVIEQIHLLDHLAEKHELYYLHPSFGYFFEHFYQEPHGLVYRLKVYPADAWDVPLADAALIAENQALWKKTFDEVLPPLTEILDKPQFSGSSNLWLEFLDRAHLKLELDWLALPLGGVYSRALNYWGVELQRANHLPEAGKCFDQALELNPRNLAVRINKAFNEDLRNGKKLFSVPTKDLADRFSGGWTAMLDNDGPVDEPNWRDELAGVLATGRNYRQAIQQLHRIKEIIPDDSRATTQLADLFLVLQSNPTAMTDFLPKFDGYALAIKNTDEVLKSQPKEPSALFFKSVALIQLKDYAKAIEPLNTLLTVQTNNVAARLNRAIANYKLGDLDAAKSDYETVANAAPKAFQVYFGLGEIAYQQKNFAEATRNYELYLTNAPPNSDEAKYVSARLTEIKKSAP